MGSTKNCVSFSPPAPPPQGACLAWGPGGAAHTACTPSLAHSPPGSTHQAALPRVQPPTRKTSQLAARPPPRPPTRGAALRDARTGRRTLSLAQRARSEAGACARGRGAGGVACRLAAAENDRADPSCSPAPPCLAAHPPSPPHPHTPARNTKPSYERRAAAEDGGVGPHGRQGHDAPVSVDWRGCGTRPPPQRSPRARQRAAVCFASEGERAKPGRHFTLTTTPTHPHSPHTASTKPSTRLPAATTSACSPPSNGWG